MHVPLVRSAAVGGPLGAEGRLGDDRRARLRHAGETLLSELEAERCSLDSLGAFTDERYC